MPDTQRQLGFAAMSRTAAGRAKLRAHGKKPMDVKTANEMVQSMKGKKLSSLPLRAKKS